MNLHGFGTRLADIRVRLGSRPSRPMPLRAFAVLIRDRTGLRIDPTELSRLERGLKTPSLAIVDAIAQVDPLRRGRSWLAWGDEGPAVP